MSEAFAQNNLSDDFLTNYKPVADILIDKQAAAVTLYDLSKISGFTNAFVIAAARSNLHARTLADAAENFLDKTGISYHTEGEQGSKWCLIDGGHIIINILTQKGIDYYRLDSLWGDAPNCKFEDTEDSADSELFR